MFKIIKYKNTSNKNSGTITAAIGGVVVGAAATKLLSNNNNVRKYTKEEANFRNINGRNGVPDLDSSKRFINHCISYVHSKSGINGKPCSIVDSNIDIEELDHYICDFHVINE